jgi:hypothetical protein
MAAPIPSAAAILPDASPPPCVYWRFCRDRAALEKGGKSVCRRCAATLCGQAYPLRPPIRQPLYFSGRDAAVAMEMIESNHKRLNRSGSRGRSS